jgi:hypothetical protein
MVCEALAPLAVQLRNLDEAIAGLDRAIAKMAQERTGRLQQSKRRSGHSLHFSVALTDVA